MGPGQLQQLKQWRLSWLCESERACPTVPGPGNHWQISETVEKPKPANILRLQ